MTKKVTVIVEGCKYLVEVGEVGERPIKATVNDTTYLVQVPTHTPATPVEGETGVGEDFDCLAITAPMPGDIIEVSVKAGDRINTGDLVCVLEAMKMKNMIRTSRPGVIASVEVSAGQSVDFGAVLVTFE